MGVYGRMVSSQCRHCHTQAHVLSRRGGVLGKPKRTTAEDGATVKRARKGTAAVHVTQGVWAPVVSLQDNLSVRRTDGCLLCRGKMMIEDFHNEGQNGHIFCLRFFDSAQKGSDRCGKEA
jgi:hypothetical protein